MRFIATAFLAILTLANVAKADSLVPGSTFDVVLADFDNINKFALKGDYTLVVGGGPVAFTFGTASGTITESEVSLGNQQYSISVQILSNSDFFPVTPNGGLGFVGAGVADPFDLTAPFDLTSIFFTYTGPNTTFGPNNATHFLPQTDPWDGYSIAPATLFGVFGSQGRGFDEIDIEMDLTQLPPTAVPEPASLALTGTGLLGFVASLRRRTCH